MDELVHAGLAGSFAQAQLRFRKEQAQAKHAHGYEFQTLADLGLIGVAVSLVGLGTWLLDRKSTRLNSSHSSPSRMPSSA